MFEIYSFWFCHERGYPPLACVIYNCNSFCYQTLWLCTNKMCTSWKKNVLYWWNTHGNSTSILENNDLSNILYVNHNHLYMLYTYIYSAFSQNGTIKTWSRSDWTYSNWLLYCHICPLWWGLVLSNLYTTMPPMMIVVWHDFIFISG